MHDVDFGLGTGSSYLKIDARSGHFKVKNHDDEEVIFQQARFEMDLSGLETGWLAFIPGQGPQFVPGVKSLQPESINGMDFKKGFKVNIFGTDIVEVIDEALGLREVASTSYVVRQAIRDLYTDYRREAARHPDQTPVVEVHTFKSINMKNGSAYAPNFQIVDWVATRPEFGGAPDEPAEEPARPNDADLSDELPQAMRPSV